MKILFLTSRKDTPSFKFRVMQFIPYLEEHGWQVNITEIPRSIFKRILLFNRIQGYNVIFIQRKLLSNLELNILKKKGKLCYDFDDALMYKDSSCGARMSWRRNKRFKNTVRNVDLVIAGNDYLKSKAELYTKNIKIIPTIINTEKYIPNYKYKKEIYLGWIGSKSTLPYLDNLKEILESVLNTNINVKLKIVCDNFSEINIHGAILKKWDNISEIKDLQSFDIGLMPLSDDFWTRGKCGFKLIQYMAVGIPVICSPVGVNKKLVSHGKNGFLAENEQLWIQYINELIEKPNLRNKMGKSGREFIEEQYSLNYWAPKFEQLLREGTE